jgi:hypothetical protein
MCILPQNHANLPIRPVCVVISCVRLEYPRSSSLLAVPFSMAFRGWIRNPLLQAQATGDDNFSFAGWQAVESLI